MPTFKPNRLQLLRTRRNPEGILREAYASIQDDEAIVYLAGAMEPVEASYTKKTFEEADRVANQIRKGLEAENLSGEFDYQGSVTKDTHIKAYSDVDLLVLETRFHTVEPPQVAAPKYLGNPLSDLLQVRKICIDRLSSSFPEATVNQSGARSVKISGGSLARTVDVVSANWFNTNQYFEHGHKIWRGVQILNAEALCREADQPFLHGALIHYKDTKTLGNTRRLIRLLKSLKYDSDGTITISSFDIESIVYALSNEQMQHHRGEEVLLASAGLKWLEQIEADDNLRGSLKVPDQKRNIFVEGKATLAQLIAIRVALSTLLAEIEQNLRRSFRKLAEARVDWTPSRFHLDGRSDLRR